MNASSISLYAAQDHRLRFWQFYPQYDMYLFTKKMCHFGKSCNNLRQKF